MCAKMTLNCGAAFVKYFLCVLNFLLFVSGGALLVVSAWVAIDTPSFFVVTKITDNDSLQEHNEISILETGAYILVAAGAVILLIGFLGCCGAAMESKGLLATYGSLIIIVFLLEVTAGILIAIFKHKVEDHLEEYLKESLRDHYADEENANSLTAAWDAVMMKMECCGVNNYTDFEYAKHWQENLTTNYKVPRACCKFMKQMRFQDGVTAEASGPSYDVLDESCFYDPTDNNSNHLIGCHGQLKSLTETNVDILVGALVGVGTLELLLITLAFFLCASVGTKTK